MRNALSGDDVVTELPRRITVKLKGRYQMIEPNGILFLEMRNLGRCFFITRPIILFSQNHY